VEEEKYPLFNLGPFAAFVAWVQMVVPSFSAVLSEPVGKLLSDQCPFLSSDGFNEVDQQCIFFVGPHGLFGAFEALIRVFGREGLSILRLIEVW